MSKKPDGDGKQVNLLSLMHKKRVLGTYSTAAHHWAELLTFKQNAKNTSSVLCVQIFSSQNEFGAQRRS